MIWGGVPLSRTTVLGLYMQGLCVHGPCLSMSVFSTEFAQFKLSCGTPSTPSTPSTTSHVFNVCEVATHQHVLAPTPQFFLFRTDDESASCDFSHLIDLGIISVQVDRVILTPHPAPQTFSKQAQSIAEKGPIHETSKKAGAHCVS